MRPHIYTCACAEQYHPHSLLPPSLILSHLPSFSLSFPCSLILSRSLLPSPFPSLLRYEDAAVVFSQSNLSFEEVTLKFIQVYENTA